MSSLSAWQEELRPCSRGAQGSAQRTAGIRPPSQLGAAEDSEVRLASLQKSFDTALRAYRYKLNQAQKAGAGPATDLAAVLAAAVGEMTQVLRQIFSDINAGVRLFAHSLGMEVNTAVSPPVDINDEGCAIVGSR